MTMQFISHQFPDYHDPTIGEYEPLFSFRPNKDSLNKWLTNIVDVYGE